MCSKARLLESGTWAKNANKEDLAQTLEALQKVLEARGIKLACNMRDEFLLAC